MDLHKLMTERSLLWIFTVAIAIALLWTFGGSNHSDLQADEHAFKSSEREEARSHAAVRCLSEELASPNVFVVVARPTSMAIREPRTHGLSKDCRDAGSP